MSSFDQPKNVVIYMLAEVARKETPRFPPDIKEKLQMSDHVAGLIFRDLSETYAEVCCIVPHRALFVCSGCHVSANGDDVVYASLSEYYALKALDTLGYRLMQDKEYGQSFECYKLALTYSARNWGPRSYVAREMRMKMARMLLENGQHEEIATLLREDAEVEGYAKWPFASLYIRYAYGHSLVRLGRSDEAVPILAQPYFAVMDVNSEDNLKVLKDTQLLILREVASGNLGFGMKIYLMLFPAMDGRLRMRDCPIAYIEFCASFSYILARDGHEELFQAIFSHAALYTHANWTPEAKLLVTAIGCAYHPSTNIHKRCIKDITSVHATLMIWAIPQDPYRIQKLQATAKFLYIWAEKESAIRILKDTYRELKGCLGSRHPLIRFCKKAVKERMRRGA